MPALSIRQPWAWLITHGYKDVENRTWSTPYRGPLLIHASKSKPAETYRECQGFIDRQGINLELPPLEHLEIGGIVGECTLIDIVTHSPSKWAMAGQYHLVLGNARSLDFRPLKGQQGLFRVPAPAPQVEAAPAPQEAHPYGSCHRCQSAILLPGAEAFECSKCGWIPRPLNVLGEGERLCTS